MNNFKFANGFPGKAGETRTGYLVRYFAIPAGRKLAENNGVRDLAFIFGCSPHTIRMARRRVGVVSKVDDWWKHTPGAAVNMSMGQFISKLKVKISRVRHELDLLEAFIRDNEKSPGQGGG